MKTYKCKKLSEMVVTRQTVLVRLDLNVPVSEEGYISSDFRIKCTLPTLKYLVGQKARIVVLSHLGRVKTKEDVKLKSLRPVAHHLQKLLPTTKVQFVNDIEGKNLESAINKLGYGEIVLMENTRIADVISINGSFDPKQQRESSNSEQLGRYWASLGQVFVNDAFAMAHRSHASNVGIATFCKVSCIGFLVERELSQLQKLVVAPQQPFLAFIGGVKISDKIKLLEHLLPRADKVVIGGAMAYTFLAASGVATGKSLVETDQLPLAKRYLTQFNTKIVLPLDFVTNADPNAAIPPVITPTPAIQPAMMGLDVGPRSTAHYRQMITRTKMIF